MKYLFFGDLCITESNCEKFASGNGNEVFSDSIINLFRSCDFSCINLESPLISNEAEPIKKCGPILGAKRECSKGLSYLKPDLVCLANNHIYDYGYSGLITTIDELDKNKINYVGSVVDGGEEPYLVNGDVAILNCCEKEFSFNPKDNSGAFCFSDNVFKILKKLSSEGKKIIVVFHGGTENFDYPSPKLVELCHSFVDFGANLVLCQHSHRIGCLESYKTSNIVYGQGNFLFDEYSKSDKWTQSLGVIYDSSSNNVEYVVSSFKDGKVSLIEDSARVLDEVKARSEKITNKKYLNEYTSFSKQKYIKLLCKLRGYSKIRTGIEVLIFKGFFIKMHYLGKKKHVLYDLLNCEAQRELINTNLEDKVFDKTKNEN